ncbi:hypothetical protein CNMCM5623_007512 [Aspergillus felis]|uniref:Uncharacterized protein n=1 Tax=Aspergillus felis TaxID=1287682 RepID=A0A8H6QZC9_9EURO|nr:hypothetical protein CNMCM5623_007512 [Aspergillus felis]KAF7181534.1 hypothetical protein CNMCM7691_000753 [Aspergillus felis]
MATTPEPIAIIGSACRFPGGSNTPSKLWELLRNPHDVLQKIPPNRYDPGAYYHPDPTHHGTTDVQESYFLEEDPFMFDNTFFNIQSGESEAMDPQHRMLLETVYDALCDTGIPMELLRGSSTSVFVGLMCDDWSGLLTRDWDAYPTYASTGMGRSIASNRISYTFDWHGPSMTIDTACSSSLVAVHQAVQTILSGESRVALAAGSNLILSPAMYIAESKLRMLSPNSRSRMWDADADGYARGEGVAAVFLKSLSAALEDGDDIQCVIRATGVNQDGRTPGLTMPSSSAQAELIKQTYLRAGLDINVPQDRPHFFQAHGTGTPAGDPQEAEAIAQAFFQNGNPSLTKEKLLVGSVKTVIGHTEGTAGLASLITAIEAIRHGIVPPNMHFNHLSPKVEPFYQHLEVPTVAKKWPSTLPGQPRRVSINSFGFGGTNAHAIIESFEPRKSDRTSDGPLITPFVFSAASEAALLATLEHHKDFLSQHPRTNLCDFAWTLQERRSTLAYRKSVAASSLEDLISQLDTLLGEGNDAKFEFKTRYMNKPTARILGVFTGQGAQWPRMGAKLLEQSPLISEYIEQLDNSLSALPHADRPSWTIRDELLAPPSASRLAMAEISQPLCTAVQIILVNLLRLAGIELVSVVGHSSGEIGAAYASGLISASNAIRIAYYRGFYAKLAQSPNGSRGAMMAVGTTLDDARDFCELEEFEGRLQVAASNSPSSITISGDEAAVDEAVEIFKDEQKFARKLKVDTAYHSHHMLPCAKPYLESLSQCDCIEDPGNGPRWHSSVSPGQEMTKATLNTQYWVDNMTNPVMFSSSVTHAVQEDGPFDMVLEIGPHPALKGPCTSCLEDIQTGIPHIGLLSRNEHDLKEFAAAMGQVWTHLGAGFVSFSSLDLAFSGSLQRRQLVPGLPLYPFNHNRSFRSLSRISSAQLNNHSRLHPLLGRQCIESTSAQEVQWKNIIRPKEISWLRCHRLQGQIVFAATAYIAMALDAAAVLADRTPVLLKLEDVSIQRAMAFNDENSGLESLFTATIVKSDVREFIMEFACYSSMSNDTPMSRNAKGRVIVYFEQAEAEPMPTISTESFNLTDIEIGRFYKSLSTLGYEYEPPFDCIREIKRKQGYAMGKIEDMSGSAWEDQLIVHPGMMDTALQTISAAYCCPGDGRLFTIHVPTFIKSLVVNPRYTSLGVGKQRVIPYQSVVRESYHGNTIADVNLFNEDGTQSFIQVEGVTLKPFSPPTTKDDAVMFSEFKYGVADVDGELAMAGDRPTSLDVERATDLERISFFYLMNLLRTITQDEKARTLSHYRKLLDWAAHVEGLVDRGVCPAVPPEHKSDTYDMIKSLIAKNSDRVDFKLVEAVGENLPTVIKGNGNILEHMTKNGVLDDFYGIETANDWLARMVEQLAHRYPRMSILEIGAGTGGSTRVILPRIEAAFSSYTYTDISSAFFEAAEQRFEHYANRMVFRTFDMERPPVSQGYAEGTYDLVIAANVLHATNRLEEMMTNVRQLLRPGGYIMVFEVISNDALRIGLPMGGLPGWWVGADSGRPWGPTLTLPQWDSLLRKCGFSGIDTATPHYHALHPGAVFASQAVDDRVAFLRSPLSALLETPFTIPKTLTIIGGKKFQVHQLIERILSSIDTTWAKIIRITSIEQLDSQSLPEGSSVLSLTELDEPLLRCPTPAKLNSLKGLWQQARNILWLTSGSREAEPHSFMMVGLGRAMRAEHPNINLQMLDIENINRDTPHFVAEALLRHEFMDSLGKEKSPADIMYTSEPEIAMEDGRALIPRLYPRKESNLRYNSSRRLVTKEVDPQLVPVRMVATDELALRDISPLRVTKSRLSATSTVRVSHSLLPSIFVKGVGYLMIAAGIELSTKEAVFTFGLSAESLTPSMSTWTIPQAHIDPVEGILSIAAFVVAENILNTVPVTGTLLVHDVEQFVANALVRCARFRGVKLLMTTSQKDDSADTVYIHPRLPQRLIRPLIPQDVSGFVNLEHDCSPDSVGKSVGNLLSQNCVVTGRSAVFGKEVELCLEPAIEEGQKVLQRAWKNIDELGLVSAGQNQVLLSEISTDITARRDSTVIDWRVPSVSVEVAPIDEGVIFGSNKTFVLVGLAGELGQSIARWMVEHGAKHIVLTSRRPNVDPRFIDSLAAFNAHVRVMPCDVTSRVSLNACFEEIHQTMPPVAGVANGAMILKDAMFENMSFEDFMACLRPKVDGTLLLDELLHDTPLDFFIVFSSLTAVVGNSGQSNYAAANMFMTALASQRKKRGVVGSTIDISSLMGIGYVERSEKLDADYFTRLGYTNIAEQDLHQLFAEAIAAGRPDSTAISEIVTGVSPIFADQDVKAQFLTDLKFCHFVLERRSTSTQASKTRTVPVRIRLADAQDVSQAEEIIKEAFIARLKRTLQIPPEECINENVSLVEQGIDSLMAVEVRTWFLRELDVDMPVLKVLAGGNIQDLVHDAVRRLPPGGTQLPGIDNGVSNPVSEDSGTNPISSSQESSQTGQTTPASTPTYGSNDSVPASKQLLTDTSVSNLQGLDSPTEITVPLSFGQSRLWFLQHYLEDKKTFNMAVMFQLKGALRIDDLSTAVQVVAQRHEILRTRIVPYDDDDDNSDGTPQQGILSHPVVNLERKSVTQDGIEGELQRMHDHEWDLHSWEAIKIRLLSVSESLHYVLIGAHHITLDGWSFSMFFVDLEAAYSGKPLSPLPATSQYRSFAAQQHNDYENGRMQRSIDFHRKTIPADLQPIPLFSFAKVSTRPSTMRYSLHEVQAQLEPARSDRIKQLARQCQSTTFHVYLATLQLQIFRLLPNLTDFCIGLADANRLDPKFIGTVGFLLNLLPVHFHRSPAGAKFREVVQATRNKVYRILEHSQLPFDVLLNELNIPRSADHTPLFQVFVDYRQIVQDRVMFGECKVGEERWCNARTGYDLRLEVTENPDGETLLRLGLQDSLYYAESAKMFLDSFLTLLDEVVVA